jgi:hypothetical protein
VSSLRFDLHAAAVLAPHLPSLAALRTACRSGELPAATGPLVLPIPARLPANERRRASQVVRLTMACIEQVLESSPFAGDTLRSVFATDEGTGEVCQQTLEVLATSRQVSPLVFPNSVHNAPSAYFSIAWRNRQSSTTVSLGSESFASGLLCAVTEALATRRPVLLVAYDPAMTAPIDEVLPITEPVATAWVLGATPKSAAVPESAAVPILGSFALALGPAGSASPTPLPAWLPPHWAAHSSAAGLAALALLESAPESVCRFSLGGQLLSLWRVRGGTV